MQAKAIRAFVHANTGVKYAPGDGFRGTESQARELCAMGFVEIADEPEGESGAEGKAVEEMTVAELKELCGELGIEVPAKPKKENLVAAVRLYEAEAGEEPEGE